MTSTNNYRIVVGICTYERPDGLAALLAAIDRQHLATIGDDDLILCVVDNSRTGTAAEICDRYLSRGRFRMVAERETRKGYASARNATLLAARSLGASHLAFIDDDEAPEPHWIEALMSALTSFRAEAAIGPVYPVFPVLPRRWLPTECYATLRPAFNGYVADGYTGNAIVGQRILASGILFDPDHDRSGGEDAKFFAVILRSGMRIAWAGNAIVHETVPTERMRIAWLWRRWRRTGYNEARLLTQGGSRFTGASTNAVKGSARIAGGALKFAAIAVTRGWHAPDRLIASAFTFQRGLAYVAAAGAGLIAVRRPGSSAGAAASGNIELGATPGV